MGDVLQLLEEGEATLYAHAAVSYVEPEEAGAYKDPEPAKFVKKPTEYYIRLGQEAALKVGNKKEVVSLFPDHRDEIATFIKKNKIKTTKAEDLQELVKYYNSL